MNYSEPKQEAQGACGAHLVLESTGLSGVGNYGTIQNTLFMQT